MEKIKVLIIEDDYLWRKIAIDFFKELFPEISVDFAGYAIEGLKKIKSFNPQIIFLDIEMPYGTGFDLLDIIEKRNFEVIFSTGHELNPLKLKSYSPVGVLQKPLTKKSFYHVVSLAILKIESKIANTIIRTPDSKQISIENIIRIEADGSYSIVYFTNNKSLIIAKNIGKIEESLSNSHLFRLNRSNLINLFHVKKYSLMGKLEIEMTCGYKLFLGRNKKNHL